MHANGALGRPPKGSPFGVTSESRVRVSMGRTVQPCGAGFEYRPKPLAGDSPIRRGVFAPPKSYGQKPGAPQVGPPSD